MAQPQIYEGTAEEIAEQIRTSDMTGKLRAILTPSERDIATTDGSGETLDKALAWLLEEADNIKREKPVPHTAPHEIAFGEIMQEKHRKMGFKVYPFVMPIPSSPL